MVTIQEINFRTKNTLFTAHIKKINDSKYNCRISSDDKNNSFSNNQARYFSSAKQCFKALYEEIQTNISHNNTIGTLEIINNINNCIFITKEEQQQILIDTPSIDIQVNGK